MAAAKRSVLITGGTVNMGFFAAMQIARERPDYTIVLASRSDKEDSAATINKTLGQNNVIYMPLDLSDLSNVRNFVKEWEAKALPPIDALLLNAGLQFPGEAGFTAEGYEQTFAINHLGHALLFHLLLPRHLAPGARVVVTASDTHDPARKTGMPEPHYTDAETLAHPATSPAAMGKPGRQRYTESKLCNVLWTHALARRLGDAADNKNITVVAFNPGLMPGTGLARAAAPPVRFIWGHVLPRMLPLLRLLVSSNIHSPAESAAALAWIATDPAARRETGVYYDGRTPTPSSADSYDLAKQDDLWNWTIRAVGAEESFQAFVAGH